MCAYNSRSNLKTKTNANHPWLPASTHVMATGGSRGAPRRRRRVHAVHPGGDGRGCVGWSIDWFRALQMRTHTNLTPGLIIHKQTPAGGWPMTVFLTPDRRPFSGGTYFPPDRFGSILTRCVRGMVRYVGYDSVGPRERQTNHALMGETKTASRTLGATTGGRWRRRGSAWCRRSRRRSRGRAGCSRVDR